MRGILDWHSQENILGFNFTELNFCEMFWGLVVIISIKKKNLAKSDKWYKPRILSAGTVTGYNMIIHQYVHDGNERKRQLTEEDICL